jgi:hypothetical protein
MTPLLRLALPTATVGLLLFFAACAGGSEESTTESGGRLGAACDDSGDCRGSLACVTGGEVDGYPSSASVVVQQCTSRCEDSQECRDRHGVARCIDDHCVVDCRDDVSVCPDGTICNDQGWCDRYPYTDFPVDDSLVARCEAACENTGSCQGYPLPLSECIVPCVHETSFASPECVESEFAIFECVTSECDDSPCGEAVRQNAICAYQPPPALVNSCDAMCAVLAPECEVLGYTAWRCFEECVEMYSSCDYLAEDYGSCVSSSPAPHANLMCEEGLSGQCSSEAWALKDCYGN